MSERAAEEELPLTKAAEFLLDECRMVLPGIQALFGFQLVAVFSSEFAKRLSGGEQRLHVAAIALTAVAVGLIMTPAAIHRHSAHRVTEVFIRASSRLLVASMLPLALSLCTDFYLIGVVVTGRPAFALASGALLALLVGLWYVLPRWRGLLHSLAGPQG
jgi:hypothetical protein